MDIAVTAFGPADTDQIEHAFQIWKAVAAQQVPDFPAESSRDFRTAIDHPFPGKRFERALATLDDRPVGYLRLDLPQDDNTDNATADIAVHPDMRRRGVGRALHARAVELARGHGRKRMVGATVESLPEGPARDGAGSAFATATGARSVLTEVRRRLDVATLDHALLDRLLADAWPHADGYELVRWGDRTPDEYLDDVAYLDGRLMEDAPLGELEWEPERCDAAKLRAVEDALIARGRRGYNTGVVHRASGRLVAWTLINFGDTEPWHAWQQITIVEPRHRGHRLGLLVKIENLRHVLAHEPALAALDTWNAAVNDHMIAINEAIGFRPVDLWHNWQLDL